MWCIILCETNEYFAFVAGQYYDGTQQRTKYYCNWIKFTVAAVLHDIIFTEAYMCII